MKHLSSFWMWVEDREVRTPLDYVKSQWQRHSTNNWYLGYRVVVALWFVEALIVSVVANPQATPYWPIYFTHWSFTAATFQALLALGLVIMNHTHRYDPGGGGTQGKLVTLYEWVQATSVTQAFIVTVIYWSAVYNPNKAGITFPNVQVHGLNTVFMLTDLLVVGFPHRVVTLLLPLATSYIYLVFSLIYYLAGGVTATGDHRIYPVLDWSKPAVTVPLALLGPPVGVACMHGLAWGVAYWRGRLGRARSLTRSPTSLDIKPQPWTSQGHI